MKNQSSSATYSQRDSRKADDTIACTEPLSELIGIAKLADAYRGQADNTTRAEPKYWRHDVKQDNVVIDWKPECKGRNKGYNKS